MILGVNNICIDIPPEVGRDISKYKATLGHKANHNVEPNTLQEICWAHPVLETIKMIVASHSISGGLS